MSKYDTRRRWLLFIILFFIDQSCSTEILTTINSFLRGKNVTKCTILMCMNTLNQIKTAKEVMRSGHMVSVLHASDLTEERFNTSVSINYGRIGVVLQVDCKHADNILYWASKYKKFTPNYNWLLIDNVGRNISQTLADWNVELNLQSEVVWVLALRRFEVYQTGRRPHGQLIVSELTSGEWTARRWRLDQRLDLEGLVLNVSLVVKPNSVAGLGGTKTSDAPQLHDSEKIIKYITDDEFPHLDSIIKFSWAIFDIQKGLFNFSLRLLPTSSWGYKFDGNEFDGMVGLISNGSADVGATILAIRTPRLSAIDYTAQLWPYQSVFILRHPRQSARSDAFTSPLSQGVWLSVGVVVVFVFTLLWSSNWLHHQPWTTDGHSWAAGLIIILSALAQQGSVLVPKQPSPRIVFLSLFVWASLLYQFYTSSLVSSLLLPPRRYINNIADLVHSPFTIGFEKIITSKDILTRFSAVIPEVKEMYEKCVAPRGEAAFYTPAEGVHKIKQGRFAFYVDPASANKIIEDSFTQSEICDLVDVVLNPKEVLSFLVQKDSPFKKLFIYGQRRFQEVGIVHRELTKWKSRRPVCVKSSHDSGRASATEPVGISDSSPAFILLALGIVTSLAILLCEILHFRYTRVRNQRGLVRHGYLRGRF